MINISIVNDQETDDYRSSSNGEASQSSSATEPQMRSRRPRALRSRHCGILSLMRIVSRSPSGWSWLVSTIIWEYIELVAD